MTHEPAAFPLTAGALAPEGGVASPRPWAAPVSAALALIALLDLSNAWQLFVLGPDGDPSASSLARALYLPGYAAALALLALNPGRTLRALRRSLLLAVLLGLALLSTLWSVDPDVTLRRGVALLLTTLAGVGLAAAFSLRDLARVLALLFLILGLASLATGLALPSLGRMSSLFPGAWRGVWLEKNALGDHMALGCVVALGAAFLDARGRRLWLFAAGLALLLVLLSTSKTSLVSLAAALAVLGFATLARRGPASATASVFVAVCLLLLAAGLVLLEPDRLLSLAGKDATLTGRTRIWAAILRQADQRPWLGWGYGAVWNSKDRFGPLAFIIKDAGFEPFEAHDTWLSVRLDLGLSGLAVFGLYMAETWLRGLRRALTGDGAAFALPLLAFLTVEQISETAALDYNDFIWAIFAAVGAGLALEAGREPAPEAGEASFSAPRQRLRENLAGGEGRLRP